MNYDNIDDNSSSSGRCRFNRTTNQALFLSVYAGIPENIILNILGFLLLFVLFSVLRKKAWDYGRLALLHKRDNKWMELFYGNNLDQEDNGEAVYTENTNNTQYSPVDKGFLTWIVTVFKLTDAQLLHRAGPDGLLYISFERHLILFTFLITLVSLFIALPINYNGGLLKNPEEAFARTTLANLDPSSSWLWAHTIINLSYLPIGMLIMTRFIKRMRTIKPGGELMARTLIVSEISKHQCKVETLTNYFKDTFVTINVENITLVYDIERLSALHAEKDCIEQARLYCENYSKNGEFLKMHPYVCGQFARCCCNTVDALEFYTSEEVRLTTLLEEEKSIVVNKPTGVAFVTLKTVEAARFLKKELRASPTINWIVNYAPNPTDILWNNLTTNAPCWYFKALVINVILAIILIILFTPPILVPIANTIKITGESLNLNPIITSFLPTVFMVSMSALTPVLAEKSEIFVRHWTKSSFNRTVMRKSLIYLILMVLLFPSLGLSVIDFLKYGKSSNGGVECVFLPDQSDFPPRLNVIFFIIAYHQQGAIFVNYVITSAFIGSALELVRFPELAIFTFRLCIARSKAEQMYIRRAVLWEFPLGAHYAWLLLIFTMTTVYSVACPLITIFGLLYFLIKHMVDRYNLCFAYGPSVGGGNLIETAVTATGIASIIAQIIFCCLVYVRKSSDSFKAVQLIGVVVNIIVLFTVINITKSKSKRHLRKEDSSIQNFVPPVLRQSTIPMEETISMISASDINMSSPKSTTSSSLPENILYQDYNQTEKV